MVGTIAVLGLWAGLTLAAPWLAEPVSQVVWAIWDLTGYTAVTAEDLE